LGVRMAEMGGLEWLHELLRLDRSLSVIMTSCSNEPGTIAEALRLGARDYLAPLSRKRNSMRRCSGRSTLMDLLNNLPRTN
jgi:DNA-binding NarL/FixJ family response regulator